MFAEFQYRDAKKVLNLIESQGFEARLAGGCVRDRLLGKVPKDYDIATTAEPAQVCSICEHFHLKVIPTGIDHGTVTVVTPTGPVEVTTLRLDVATDGRRATIAFAKSFADDAARRDFTINAMFEDKDGRVYDYFSGKDHLKEGKLVFVGNSRERIREDYLRILRLFRFAARLEFAIDPSDLQIIAEEAKGLTQVSQERITSELLMILGAENPDSSIRLMYRTNVLQAAVGFTIPVEALDLIKQVGLEHPQYAALLRLSVLIKNKMDGFNLNVIAKNLKLSTKQKTQLQGLLEGMDLLSKGYHDDAERMELLDWIQDHDIEPVNVALSFWRTMQPMASDLILSIEQVEHTKGHLRLYSRGELPIKGSDLLGMGFSQGPNLGKILGELKKSYRNGKWTTKEDGLKILGSILGK